MNSNVDRSLQLILARSILQRRLGVQCLLMLLLPRTWPVPHQTFNTRGFIHPDCAENQAQRLPDMGTIAISLKSLLH